MSSLPLDNQCAEYHAQTMLLQPLWFLPQSWWGLLQTLVLTFSSHLARIVLRALPRCGAAMKRALFSATPAVSS
jgi:hypothetical protein